MSRHTMRAYCPFGLGHIAVSIDYTYTRGTPADRINPADPDEVELIAVAAQGYNLSPWMQGMLREWAEEYLADDGRDAAIDNARDER